jgi:hypothetical protein
MTLSWNSKKEKINAQDYCLLSNQEASSHYMEKMAVGKDMFLDETMLPNDSIVEMFHAATPESSKQHILKSRLLRPWS